MSTEKNNALYSVADFEDLLRLIAEYGLQTVVIGGCAVGAYARYLDQQVLSRDLDLYATRDTQKQILQLMRDNPDAVVRKIPKVRSIPVLVFDWKGKEVNILTAAELLPSPELLVSMARDAIFPEMQDLTLLLGDPYQLLRNKLAVNRPKDQPHAAVLRQFLEAEIVQEFTEQTDPRRRIAPAQQYLQALSAKVLPDELARRLVQLARLPVDFRFLMNHVPTEELAQDLIDRAPVEQAGELAIIRSRRRFRC